MHMNIHTYPDKTSQDTHIHTYTKKYNLITYVLYIRTYQRTLGSPDDLCHGQSSLEELGKRHSCICVCVGGGREVDHIYIYIVQT